MAFRASMGAGHLAKLFQITDLDHQPELWLPPAGISGSPIDSVANAGTAGGSFVAAGGVRPGVGSINGVPCADFDGSDDYLATTKLDTDFATTTEWHGFMVVELDAYSGDVGGAPSPEVDNLLIGNKRTNPAWGLSTRTTEGRVRAFHYDGSPFVQAAASGLVTGVAALIEWSLVGGVLRARVGAGTAVTAAASPASLLGFVVEIGRNHVTGLSIDGRIAEPLVSKVAYSGADLTRIRAYYARIYGVTV